MDAQLLATLETKLKPYVDAPLDKPGKHMINETKHEFSAFKRCPTIVNSDLIIPIDNWNTDVYPIIMIEDEYCQLWSKSFKQRHYYFGGTKKTNKFRSIVMTQNMRDGLFVHLAAVIKCIDAGYSCMNYIIRPNIPYLNNATYYHDGIIIVAKLMYLVNMDNYKKIATFDKTSPCESCGSIYPNTILSKLDEHGHYTMCPSIYGCMACCMPHRSYRLNRVLDFRYSQVRSYKLLIPIHMPETVVVRDKYLYINGIRCVSFDQFMSQSYDDPEIKVFADIQIF